MRGSCIAGFWTQGFSTSYMGKPVASRFGQMVNRIQDWWILIPFGNRVYHLPKPVSFKEKRLRKPETNIQKRFEDMKSEFSPGFSNKENSRMPFQTFGLFQEFSTETSKTTRDWVNASLPKHQSVLLVCFNGSCHAVASRFIHDVIQVNRLLFGIRVAFFSVLRARKGTKFEKYYNNWTNAWSKIFNCFKEISFFKPKGIVWDDLIRKYPAMQKFIQ